MNNRRMLTVSLGAGCFALSFPALAQPANRPVVVGILAAEGLATAQTSVDAFKLGLQRLGYVEGRNLDLHLRLADGKLDLVAGLAAELVNLQPDVIVSAGAVTTRALQKLTRTIPVVMANVADPVGAGLVETLARPGGNITGLSSLGPDIGAKHLEMLLSVVPKLSRVAVLVNPGNPSSSLVLNNVQLAARKTATSILPVEAPAATAIEAAFRAMGQWHAGAVIVARDGIFVSQVRQIAQLALKHRLASIAEAGAHAEAGALISYGANLSDQYRRAAGYVDRLVKGARPADLPVEQPTKFELVVHRGTAKALGLTIPQSLLISIDRMIE